MYRVGWAIAVMIVVSGCTPNGIKRTKFGNLSFLGDEPHESASVILPWPEDLVIKSSDGTQCDRRLELYDFVRRAFGDPTSEETDRLNRRFATFRKADVVIAFENERLESVTAYEGAVLVN